MNKRRKKLVGTIIVFFTIIVPLNALKLWNLSNQTTRNVQNIFSRQLDTSSALLFHFEPKTTWKTLASELQIKDLQFSLEIPHKNKDLKNLKEINCSGKTSSLSTYLKKVVAKCLSGERVVLLFNLEDKDGFTASIYKPFETSVFVDKDPLTSLYSLYTSSSRTHAINQNPYNEFFLQPEDVSQSLLQSSQETSPSSAYSRKYKMVFVANKEYSQYHGNTIESVSLALQTLLTRVNFIYSQELGVSFHLIQNYQDAICLDIIYNNSLCETLPNNRNILSVASDFLESLNITEDLYDIGHSLTTYNGGEAAYPSLCKERSKAYAFTGLPIPEGDKFAVDFVAHEIGHQVRAGHAFRDCSEINGRVTGISAVEPGSGSTIMGYASLCGEDDLQELADPYFNNLILEHMREYLITLDCGEVDVLSEEVPLAQAIPFVTIPIGSNFQLRGVFDQSVNVENDYYFSWDRIDPGVVAFDDVEEGQLRSWSPSLSQSRFFPNLGFILYQGDVTLDDSNYLKAEVLPQIEKTMLFRFTLRKFFETEVENEDFNYGYFSFWDTNLTFVESNGVSISNIEVDEEQISVQVNPGDLFDIWAQVTICISVAENILPEISNISEFNSRDYTIDLPWQQEVCKLLQSNSTFTQNVNLPPVAETGEWLVIAQATNLLDQELEEKLFYIFDLQRINLVSNAITTSPFAQVPSAPPTNFPFTLGPTRSPEEWVFIPPNGPTPSPTKVDEGVDYDFIFFVLVRVSGALIFIAVLLLAKLFYDGQKLPPVQRAPSAEIEGNEPEVKEANIPTKGISLA
eukprot:snap_masked-scaffold_11-processed-gene-12.58-mRNA-1 protein AED:1.00 eAED:1.00 QI:0/0/0/0/1/1/2/0/798